MRDVNQSVVASVQILLTETDSNWNNGFRVNTLSLVVQGNFSFLVENMGCGMRESTNEQRRAC